MYFRYNQIVPPNLWQEQWEKLYKIAGDLFRDKICADAVSPGYAIKNITNENGVHNNFIMIVQDDDGQFKGVLQADIKPQSAYIDVVCARKYFGSPLIQQFINFFDELFPHNHIQLSAMPNVLSYYQRWNFKFRHSCGGQVYEPDLTKYIEAVSRKDPVSREPKPAFVDEKGAYKNDAALDVMAFLQLHELNATASYKAGCKSEDVKRTRRTIPQNECGNDGYTMFRCPVSSHGLTGGRRH
jgi:hypothetical protein